MKFAIAPVVAAAMWVAFAGGAVAAPTAEEAAQLGKTLTPLGAIKAGNADGTIPAWDGGICTPPAGYKPRNGIGGFPYIDPFAAEKPLYTINASNMDKYADKLDDGNKLLLKRYPTYRLDVYPTHRTACFPDYVYENTVKKVMSPKTTAGGVGMTGAHAQVPFPIPKTGYEAMWNSLVKYQYPFMRGDGDSHIMDASGGVTQVAYILNDMHTPYWDNTRGPIATDEPYWSIRSVNLAPAAQKGSGSLLFVYLQPEVKDNISYSYIPGQRRVRMAPEFKYDTVSTNSGGVLLYDEINGFYGAMDRFDFKLIGRKEMYVQYNAWRSENAPVKKSRTKDHMNPDYQRWELHRVWIVQADLKPGQRHVEKQKVFLIDEDSWSIMAYYGVDQAGKPYHYMQLPGWQEYEKPSFWVGNYFLYDFNKGIWSSGAHQGNPDVEGTGYYKLKPFPAGHFAPEALAGSSIR
jgi:hypothetical protein